MLDVVARVFMVRHDRMSWLPAAIWSAAAVLSISAAFWIAMQPGRLGDLHEVRSWLSYAFAHSANPYSYFDRQLDYPPIALLVLWPLSLIPGESLAFWFLPAILLISAAAGWIFVHVITDRLYTRISTPQHVAIVALILSGSSVRTAIWLGQTVALAVLFGVCALLWSRKRPFLAALALAACSFKPHLAVGFGLVILLIDGIDVVVIAVAIVVTTSLLVSAAINQSVLAMLAGYAHNLVTMYDGPGHIRGLLSLRWIFEDTVGHYQLATTLYVFTALASLVAIGIVARRAPDAAGRTQATAAALLWPLLFLPSQLYNGLLAGPALWLLMWPESELIRSESRRLLCVVPFVLFGILDLPRIVRFTSDWMEDGHWLYKASYYLSPLRLAVLFGFILIVAFRRARSERSALAM